MAYDAADGSADRVLRKHVETRLRGLRRLRQDVELDWLDVSKFCRSRTRGCLVHAGQPTTEGVDLRINRDVRNTKIMDGRALIASRILGNGLTSSLTSHSRPWFKLTTSDPDLRKFQSVKEWLDVVERAIYDFLSSINFYPAQQSGFKELGDFGVEAAFMVEHWNHGGAVYPLTAGEFWLGTDDALQVDTVARYTEMSVIQIMQKFDRANVPLRVTQKYDRSDYSDMFVVYHMIEPNADRQAGFRDKRNKRFRSLYWMVDQNQTDACFLEQSGFSTKPFWAPRWDTVGADVYSSSPAMDAMADIRQLQLQVLRKQQAMDFAIRPALAGHPSFAQTNMNLMPGRFTPVAAMAGKEAIWPIWEVDARAIQMIATDAQETRKIIDTDMYVDLFQAFRNMEGIQPRNIEEIARRNEENLAQLGPVVERVQNEKLSIAVDRAFMILLQAGALPPAPPEAKGGSIEIEFISTLAQAQRLVGLGSIERVTSFVGNLMAAFPEAGDKLNIDQAIDEYADIAGSPATIINSDQAVANLRQQRQQLHDQQQQAAAVQQLAPAAKDGAQAARLMSETDTGDGANMLQRLLAPQ